MPYLFGYGSLLNDTFNNIYKKISYATLIPTTAFSIRRSFNVHCDWKNPQTHEIVKYTALGIEYVPYQDSRIINGLIIQLNHTKLTEIIEREHKYKLVFISSSLFTYMSPLENITIDEKVIIFIPIVSEYPDSIYPLNNKYIDNCIKGFSLCSKQFATDFIESTY